MDQTKSFKSAQIEAGLHDSITKQAKNNNISFSAQVLRWKETAEEITNYERRKN